MKARTDILIAAFMLVRPLNLLFIALTQYLLFFHFLFPLFRSAGATVLLEGWRAWAFLLTTTLIAAAGYVMNDLYDIETDKVNKPHKWLVGNRISHGAARIWSGILLLAGGVSAALIAIDIREPRLWLLYPLSVILLWVYSRHLKGRPLAGNLLIALFCAMVAGIVWFAEREGFSQLGNQAKGAAGALVFYLAFAFLATLFREIVKDCEDVKGDLTASHRTLPIVAGISKARQWAIASGLLLDCSFFVLAAYLFQQSNWAGFAYTLALLALPLSWGLAEVWKARSPADFRRVSQIAKWVIFAGVFLILFIP